MRKASTATNEVHGEAGEGAHVLEMQRRRLLLGYTEVLAEHGLEGASVDRICKRAAISRRTFYDLFDDREACSLAAFEDAVERIAAALIPVYESEQRWRARIRTTLSALLEIFDTEPALARLCVVEALKAGPRVLERRQVMLESLAVIVDQGRLEGRGVQPPPLSAQGIVGGVLSVLYAQLLDNAGSPTVSGRGSEPLVALVNPLMSMIVQPYLGSAAAARELERLTPVQPPRKDTAAQIDDPFRDLSIRFTFRTARVLTAIGSKPGANNRTIGNDAGVHDQGQISKLLKRLERSGLVHNGGEGHPRGEPNAWTLTDRGAAIQRTLEPNALTTP
jgi:AcrR family transcriptional regulator